MTGLGLPCESAIAKNNFKLADIFCWHSVLIIFLNVNITELQLRWGTENSSKIIFLISQLNIML